MEYKFTEFKELDGGTGFDYPIDVHYGTVYIGTLVVRQNGFSIRSVATPTTSQLISASKNNLFRTKIDAAAVLHKVWKNYRHGGDESLPL